MIKISLNTTLLAFGVIVTVIHHGDARLFSSSFLQIHTPKSLTRPGGYNHSEALFGTPEYDGSIEEKVYYADYHLCDLKNNSVTLGGYPQREHKEKPWVAPYILLIDRGECSFVQKVRNAQKVGAAAVIIADNRCFCSHSDECVPDDNSEMCEMEDSEMAMADDGSGSDITIPSFLMFKQNADVVRKELMANQTVRIEMSWSKINPQVGKVKYELWVNPTERMSRTFFKDFQIAALKLGDHAHFTPHMQIYDGDEMECSGDMRVGKNEDKCSKLCSVGGRYCASYAHDGIPRGIKGVDIVHESLRRECIWDIYGKENGIGREWWDYVLHFNKNCMEKPFLFSDFRCVEDSIKAANIESGLLSKCEEETGDLYENVPNKLFDNILHNKERNGIVKLPTIYINEREVTGELNFVTLLLAVCAGFTEDTKPPICISCTNKCIGYELECVKHPKLKCPLSSNILISTKTIIVWFSSFSFLLILLLILIYQARQNQQQKMKPQDVTQSSRYTSLDTECVELTELAIRTITSQKTTLEKHSMTTTLQERRFKQQSSAYADSWALLRKTQRRLDATDSSDMYKSDSDVEENSISSENS